MEKDRVILHCDMNNFYASVECLLDPSLRARPVAVCGSVEERHGIVLAKNEKAKAFGVATAEAVWQAQKKCPGLVIVSPHHGEYHRYSRLAREMYSRYTDLVEPFGLDECWLDVTGSACLGTGREIAERLRRGIREELGLTISVGVSFNKVFAKLGSDLKKPDAVTCIPRETFREQIWGLKASALLGVGKATERALAGYGIRTIGDLAAASDNLLAERFGKSGLSLKRYANGEDVSPVRPLGDRPPARSIGHGTTTPKDVCTDAEAWAVMVGLTAEIAAKLRRERLFAGGVCVSVRNCDLRTKEWQCGLDMPTQSARALAGEAFALFRRSYTWERPIRTITVRVYDLAGEDLPLQTSLFSTPAQRRKNRELESALDGIRARFGSAAIRSCVQLPGGTETERDR